MLRLDDRGPAGRRALRLPPAGTPGEVVDGGTPIEDAVASKAAKEAP